MEIVWQSLLARVIRRCQMPEHIENSMVVDAIWDEIDYGVPNKRRMNRLRQAYEEAEREVMEDD
jgi:hypothetical protein